MRAFSKGFVLLWLLAVLAGAPALAQEGQEEEQQRPEAAAETESEEAEARDEDDPDDDDRKRVPRYRGWGVRVGVADDPDQVVAGAQFDFGSVARRVYVEPNVELGIGNDRAILVFTGALHYRFNPEGGVRPYVGGGASIGLDYFDPPDADSDLRLRVALRVIGGGTWVFKSGRQFFLEGNLVIGNLHDIQLMAGWRF